MPANDDTPRTVESVSDEQFYQDLSERLIAYLLQRSTERLHGPLRQAISDADRGDLDREQYQEILEAYWDLGDALEYADELTYRQEDRSISK